MGVFNSTNTAKFCKTDEERQEFYKQGLRNAEFTDRQQLIIHGKCPNVRKNEVNNLIKKCEAKGLETLAQEVYEKYDELITGKRKPEYTLEEARAIIQSKTPWEIEWID